MTIRVEKAFEFCLKEMFLRVGEIYPNKDLTNDPDWYMLREWSEQEQDDFEKWMIIYLRKALKWTKKMAYKEASFFILMYGWKTDRSLNIETIKNE